MKTALICGISGQDGAYLSKLLLQKGYKVIGTSRDTKASNFAHLQKLGITHEIEFLAMAINDFRSVLNVFKRIQPDEVYNLAGQSSIGLSFEQPVETLESINIATLNQAKQKTAQLYQWKVIAEKIVESLKFNENKFEFIAIKKV